MKYEITIRELTPYSEEEKKNFIRHNALTPVGEMYSDEPFHQVRVLHAELSKEEFVAVKKAVIGVI